VSGIGCYQARIPIGPTKADALNLGTFCTATWGSAEAAEWAAGRAAKEFVRAYQPGRDPWSVIRQLQDRGIIPPGVLPRWVFRLPEGGYGARVRRRNIEVTVGPYSSPEAAHAEISARVALAPDPRRQVHLWASPGQWLVGVVCRPQRLNN
jgi:hypothetical protein